MIVILPLLAVLSAYIMCACVSYTDIRYNRISNKLIAIFGLEGIFLTLLQYLFKTHILWEVFFANLVLVVAFSILLYSFHIWAAGDSKLLMVLGLLLPANFCVLSGHTVSWGVFIVALSFLMSFFFLVAETIVLFIRGRDSFSIQNIKKGVGLFFVAYVRNIIYISFVLKLEELN